MPDSPQPDGSAKNIQTIVFMVVLSFVCALILSLLASALAEPKEIAKDLDRSKQMMIAAKVLDHNGYFLLKDADGKYLPAKYSEGKLVAGSPQDIASREQLIEVYKKRFRPVLVNDKGEVSTFEEAGIDFDNYVESYKKTGYHKQPQKLMYEILPNGSLEGKDKQPEGYVIPVNGLGLWDAIYGYLALKPDGNTVIGATWYDQKETPGLGANIADAPWQNLFPGKKVFQENASGQTDFKTGPLGITVIKGKVAETYGEIPKAKSAVDGMAGATLTGNGVTDAYREVLAGYRPFLIKINSASQAEKG